MIVAGIGCRTGVSAEAVVTLVQEASALAATIVIPGLVPGTYSSGRPDGVAAPQGVGPRVKPEGDGATNALAVPAFRTGVSAEAVVALVQEASALAATIVIPGLVQGTYPSGRTDGVAAPQGVGPRVKPEGDDGKCAFDEGKCAFDEGKCAGDEGKCAGDEAINALAVPAFRQSEPGIAEAAARLNLPILWVERDALKGEQGRCLTRSARAEAEVGLSCVAEAAALSAAGPGSRLILPRIAGGGVTCALAESLRT